MNLFPSSFFFPKDIEQKFRIQLNKRAKRSSVISAYLVSALLLSLLVISIVEGESFFSDVNVIRLLMVFISLLAGKYLRNGDNNSLHKIWFLCSLLLTSLCALLFYRYAATQGELKEGGPIMMIILTCSVNMLDLKEKLLLWLALGIGLAAIQLNLNVDITWTLFFYLAATVSMAALQYQTDMLMRSHYQYELIEAEKAQTDKLTGVFNRRSFDKEVSKQLATMKDGESFALAMIDIDNFKLFNDNYGHLAGDSALIDVAQMLSSCEADMVTRFGGEEFILTEKMAVKECDWLSDLPKRCKALNIPHKYSPKGYLTVSVGVVIVTKSNNNILSKTQLLTLADKCLYKAKAQGKNCCEYIFL